MLLCSLGKDVGIGVDSGENEDEKDSSLLKSTYSMMERQTM